MQRKKDLSDKLSLGMLRQKMIRVSNKNVSRKSRKITLLNGELFKNICLNESIKQMKMHDGLSKSILDISLMFFLEN